MKDFFISYTKNDEVWAEWIAGVLEAAEYSVFMMLWDIQPGNNFAKEMDKGLKACNKIIALISEDYMNSGYACSEWLVGFCNDPIGENIKVIPVKIEDIDIEGLLKPRVYIDLIECNEDEAKDRLLKGVSEAAIERKGAFPGVIKAKRPNAKTASFPGTIKANLSFKRLRLGDINELVGRNEAMLWLEEHLLEVSSNSAVALVSLHAMGGMGKTFLAQAFAEKHGGEHTCIPIYLGDQGVFDAGIDLLNRLSRE